LLHVIFFSLQYHYVTPSCLLHPIIIIICNATHHRFDSTKGFGFIVPDDDSGDVFVHQTSIKVDGFRSLDENQRVEFRVETDKNGKTKAMDVVSEA
jgi:cold shock CspA family protein